MSLVSKNYQEKIINWLAQSKDKKSKTKSLGLTPNTTPPHFLCNYVSCQHHINVQTEKQCKQTIKFPQSQVQILGPGLGGFLRICRGGKQAGRVLPGWGAGPALYIATTTLHNISTTLATHHQPWRYTALWVTQCDQCISSSETQHKVLFISLS